MDYLLMLVILIIYVLSVIWCRNEMKTDINRCELTFVDVVFSLIPMVNVMIACLHASEKGTWRKIAKIYFGK